MKVPDKIYIPLYPNYDLDGFHLADEWMYEPHKEVENVEYIRKDALLDWVTEKMNYSLEEADNSGDRFDYGSEAGFGAVVDKIKSL